MCVCNMTVVLLPCLSHRPYLSQPPLLEQTIARRIHIHLNQYIPEIAKAGKMEFLSDHHIPIYGTLYAVGQKEPAASEGVDAGYQFVPEIAKGRKHNSSVANTVASQYTRWTVSRKGNVGQQKPAASEGVDARCDQHTSRPLHPRNRQSPRDEILQRPIQSRPSIRPRTGNVGQKEPASADRLDASITRNVTCATAQQSCQWPFNCRVRAFVNTTRTPTWLSRDQQIITTHRCHTAVNWVCRIATTEPVFMIHPLGRVAAGAWGRSCGSRIVGYCVRAGYLYRPFTERITPGRRNKQHRIPPLRSN